MDCFPSSIDCSFGHKRARISFSVQIKHVLNLCSVEVAACFPQDVLIHLQLAKAIPKTRSYDGLKRCLLVLMTKNTETRMFEMLEKVSWFQFDHPDPCPLSQFVCVCMCVCVCVCVCVCETVISNEEVRSYG